MLKTELQRLSYPLTPKENLRQIRATRALEAKPQINLPKKLWATLASKVILKSTSANLKSKNKLKILLRATQ
jgi:hypothetical protein